TLATLSLSIYTYIYYKQNQQITIDVGGQKSPQEIFFGTELRPLDAQLVVPIEVIAGLFFVLIALMFLGLGQVVGRAFNAASNRVAAYTVNVLGSLIGIGAFMAVSHYRLSPVVWFAVGCGLALIFTGRFRVAQALIYVGILAVVWWFMGIDSARV